MLSIVDVLFNSNLAWLMYKRYNPKAKNRKQIINQYIKRNFNNFDELAKKLVSSLYKVPPHAQMIAYDQWYYCYIGSVACNSSTKPTDKFMNSVNQRFENKVNKLNGNSTS